MQVSTFETHPWAAESKKDAVLNGNGVYFPFKYPGSGDVIKVDITPGPKSKGELRSAASGAPARVKFSNRSNRHVVLKWMDPHGSSQKMKELAPRKAWLVDSYEGHYWLAVVKGNEDHELDLNHGWFYKVNKCAPERPQKVLITEPGSSSSSSSDSD